MNTTISSYVTVQLSQDEANALRTWIDDVGCHDGQGVLIDSARSLYTQLGSALKLLEAKQ